MSRKSADCWPGWARDTEMDEAMCFALRLDMRNFNKGTVRERWRNFVSLAANNNFAPPSSRPGFRVHQELLALDVLFDFYRRMHLQPKRALR